MVHNYGLEWIDQDKLYNIAFNRFHKLFDEQEYTNPPDPFTLLTQMAVQQKTIEQVLVFERERRLNKSISNAVGTFHQDVLGIADNWQNMGDQGGVLDIRTIDGYKSPRFHKPIVAEVKNRFNTIKASDEAKTFNTIDTISRSLDAQGYLFQITPKTPERYDEEWRPTGVRPKDNVRVCDGATAYEIVFGVKDALHQLFLALPSIFNDIQNAMGTHAEFKNVDRKELDNLYKKTFPL